MADLLEDPVKRVVQEHWHGRAATFDEQANHGIHSDAQRDAWIAALRPLVVRIGMRVLDVGSGTGFLSLLLAELGCIAEGIDIAPAMIERAQAKAAEHALAATFSLGDAEALDASDATYDLVVERHVLWTLPHPDAALREWLRVLRPAGKVALIEGDWGSPAAADYAPIKDALPLLGGKPSADLTVILKHAGFEEIEVMPLMAAALWGAEVERERYLITGRKPAS